MALSEDKKIVTAITTKKIAEEVAKLAAEEKRSVASMAAILIEKGLDIFKNK